MSKEIISVLDYLGQKIGITIDWTSENILPYTEELGSKLVKWEMNTSITWIGIVLVAIIVSAILNKTVDWDGMQELLLFCTVLTGVIIIIFQVFDIVTCCTFPEKIIYEYIKKLASNI